MGIFRCARITVRWVPGGGSGRPWENGVEGRGGMSGIGVLRLAVLAQDDGFVSGIPMVEFVGPFGKLRAGSAPGGAPQMRMLGGVGCE